MVAVIGLELKGGAKAQDGIVARQRQRGRPNVYILAVGIQTAFVGFYGQQDMLCLRRRADSIVVGVVQGAVFFCCVEEDAPTDGIDGAAG